MASRSRAGSTRAASTRRAFRRTRTAKKSKTGLWVGLGIGVVTVVAFVITAFVAPGFLLSDDEENSASDNGGNGGDDSMSGAPSMPANPSMPADPPMPADPGSVDGTGAGGVKEASEALLQEIVGLVNAGDTNGLRQSLCVGDESEMEDYEEAIANGEQFTLTQVDEPQVTERVTAVDAIFLNSTGDRELVLFVYDGSCVFLVSYQEPLNQG